MIHFLGGLEINTIDNKYNEKNIEITYIHITQK